MPMQGPDMCLLAAECQGYTSLHCLLLLLQPLLQQHLLLLVQMLCVSLNRTDHALHFSCSPGAC
jgi:hypothetical protein